MYQFFITVLLLISFSSVYADIWTTTEIKNIQKFSLKSLPKPTDPSNKYLNNRKAIELGKALFHDERLSSNGKVSCASCHIDKYAFTDNRKIAKGLREGFRNTSTLWNVAHQQWFFADGSKDSLWAQALSSIENPSEQNFTRMEIMRLISTDNDYRRRYLRIFGGKLPERSQLSVLPIKAGPNAKLTDLIAWKKLNKLHKNKVNKVFTNIGKSIAAFVTSIKFEKTDFDHFLDELLETNQSSYLNVSEQRGLRLFLSQKSGCVNCHNGPLMSNKTFHNIGTGIPGKDNGRSEVIESVVRDEFNCLGKYSDALPEECFELHYINRDKHQLVGTYKTSTLRGISKISPYMHDGRFETLHEVIEHYIVTSQNKSKKTDLTEIDLDENQRNDLVNFLLTL